MPMGRGREHVPAAALALKKTFVKRPMVGVASQWPYRKMTISHPHKLVHADEFHEVL